MTTFEEMQRGELDWWIAYLGHPHAVSRIFALYGYRYLPFFFEEFNHLGEVVDFGSGPISAAYIAEPAPREVICVDPLMPEYHKHELVYGSPVVEWPPLPAAVFDTALLLNVLDHCEEPQNLIREAARSLVGGGGALVWSHVNQETDSLHRTIHAAEIAGWLQEAGLSLQRDEVKTHLGVMSYMAKAVKQ